MKIWKTIIEKMFQSSKVSQMCCLPSQMAHTQNLKNDKFPFSHRSILIMIYLKQSHSSTCNDKSRIPEITFPLNSNCLSILQA